MKAMKIIFWILVLLPLPVCLIALPFLPELIPAHYDINWTVDRWGSKYETLILPAMNLFMAAIFFFSARYSAKREANPRSTVKVCYITGISCCLFFDVLSGIFLYMDFNSVDQLAPPLDITKLVFALMGVLFIVMGLIMPRQQMNSLFGIRTKSSMANPYLWRVSQLFGGVAFAVAGVLSILCCIFTSGMMCMIICIGSITLASIAASIFPAIILRRVS